MRWLTRDRLLAACFVVWLALQIGLPLRYALTDDTDNRFTWRMFSGDWRHCSAEIHGFSPDRQRVVVRLEDPADTGRRHVTALRDALCEEFARRDFVHATLTTCEEPPDYLHALALEPSLCPELKPLGARP